MAAGDAALFSTEDKVLSESSVLISEGRTAEALRALGGATFRSKEGKAAARYLQALVAWREGNFPRAARIFSSVTPVSSWIRAASSIGEALSISRGTNASSGIPVLEQSLGSGAVTPLLPLQFRLLGELYEKASLPATSVLEAWGGDGSHPERARLARLFQAQGQIRLGHPDLGEKTLVDFLKDYPGDPSCPDAALLLATTRLSVGDAPGAALAAADMPDAPAQARGRLAFIRGLALAGSGMNGDADEAFLKASSLDPSLAADAGFNRVILATRKDRGRLDLSETAQRIRSEGQGLPSEEMALQIALDLARRGDATAVPVLSRLASVAHDPGVRFRAAVAAVEAGMDSGKNLSLERDFTTASAAGSEREGYLRIFLMGKGDHRVESDSSGESGALIREARGFLAAFPASPFAPDVRLKLAEALLKSGDTQGARGEFEQLAATAAGSDLGRRSLFLAAQSASRVMDPASMDDSLMLLERIASTGAPDAMAWQARLQEGTLKNAQNLPLEALAIYDTILGSRGTNGTPSPDRELCSAALMAKGDTLHQLGVTDTKREKQAVAAWRELAGDPAVPIRKRNQALCKAGDVLASLGDGEGALESYRAAFTNDKPGEAEQLWHDRAGFQAARLLENRRDWRNAVNLYCQLIAQGGPRASEAKARLSDLRLKNFLWDN